MNRGLAIVMAAALAGCAEGGGGPYTLDRGPVTYDSLKAATEKCRADGGHIVLKSGYDNREMSNYVCRMGEAR